MNLDSTQGYAPYAAAAVLALLVIVIVAVVRRRRRAAEAQAALREAYAEAVGVYRAQVEQLLTRREGLLAGISAIESGHLDESLNGHDVDTTDPVVRLELDVVLAGDDQEQRESSLRALRRGVSDLEILLPEAPLPPAPVTRLSRRARARAEAWQHERTAELETLRRLAQPAPAAGPAGTVPAQAVGPRATAEPQAEGAVVGG